MFIDDPNFPKRRVVLTQNQPIQIGFGSQRAQLANYVADELNNNHKNDAAILQKFRKQAQIFKKNKLHQKHSIVKNISQPYFIQEQFRSEPIIKIKDTKKSLRVITTQSENEEQKHKIKQNQDRQNLQRSHQEEVQKNKELLNLLRKKEKQCQKQAKILRKNEQKLDQLRKRVQNLQKLERMKQMQRLASIQQNSYDRIQQYISSMTNKIKQNKSMLEQTLNAKNKVQRSSPRVDRIKQPNQSKVYKSGYLSNKKIVNPQYEYQLQEQQRPTIKYKYKVGNEQDVELQRFGIKSIIQNLGNSRNRLDALGSFL